MFCKASACNVGDPGSIPGSGRSPGEENGNPLQYSFQASTLAWKIPWTEEPGRLQSMGSQRVRQDWVTSHHFTSLHFRPSFFPLVAVMLLLFSVLLQWLWICGFSRLLWSWGEAHGSRSSLKCQNCHMTQQSHCWAYTPRKQELKEKRVPQCSSQHCL